MLLYWSLLLLPPPPLLLSFKGLDPWKQPVADFSSMHGCSPYGCVRSLA